jgi:hypothetical protein
MDPIVTNIMMKYQELFPFDPKEYPNLYMHHELRVYLALLYQRESFEFPNER